ncbi:MAG: hypothetical protein SGPRY_005719, partial [Prymnesium sp.]
MPSWLLLCGPQDELCQLSESSPPASCFFRLSRCSPPPPIQLGEHIFSCSLTFSPHHSSPGFHLHKAKVRGPWKVTHRGPSHLDCSIARPEYVGCETPIDSLLPLFGVTKVTHCVARELEGWAHDALLELLDDEKTKQLAASLSTPCKQTTEQTPLQPSTSPSSQRSRQSAKRPSPLQQPPAHSSERSTEIVHRRKGPQGGSLLHSRAGSHVVTQRGQRCSYARNMPFHETASSDAKDGADGKSDEINPTAAGSPSFKTRGKRKAESSGSEKGKRQHDSWRGIRRLRELAKEPENWPAKVIYTPFLLWNSYDGEISSADWLRLHSSAPRPLPDVRIQQLPRDHPLADAKDPTFGLFARHDLEVGRESHIWMLRSPECEMCACQAGVFLGEYTGMVQRRDNTKTFEQGGQYLATVSVPLAGGGTLELDIDAEEAGNEMRCMNDYHMMASEPNVEFRGMRHFSGEPGMGVFTLHRVSAGSELLVNYGEDYWNR